MSLVASSTAEREVEYPVYAGLDPRTGAPLPLAWRVTAARPPTTGEALTVLALAETPSEDGHREALLGVARGWLRPRAASDLRSLTDVGLAHTLAQLVAQASAAVPSKRTDVARARRRLEQAGPLDEHVIRLALSLSLSPADVLSMPWPLFLGSALALPAVQAEAQLRAASTAALPNMTGRDRKAALRRLHAAAGSVLTDEAEGEVDPDAVRAQRDHVRRQLEHFKATRSMLYSATTAEA